MGIRTSFNNSIPDPLRDPEIEEHLLNAPNPEVPNLENWDDQDADFEVDAVTIKQKSWLDT
jgi:hypothetical protein